MRYNFEHAFAGEEGSDDLDKDEMWGDGGAVDFARHVESKGYLILTVPCPLQTVAFNEKRGKICGDGSGNFANVC